MKNILQENSKQETLFFFTTFLILCTNLRNLPIPYYLITSLLILFLLSDKMRKFFIFDRSLSLFYTFFYYTLFIIAISFVYWLIGIATDGNLLEGKVHKAVDPFIGVPRIILMPLLAYILVHSFKFSVSFERLLKLVLFVYLLASLLIILQVAFTGPLDWLGMPSHRGGYRRFTSIIGSITVFGSTIGYVIIILLLNRKIIKNRYLKLFLFLIFTSACFLSLSKVGIFIFVFSLFLLFAYLFVFNIRRFLSILIFLLITGVGLYYFLSTDPEYQRFVNTAFGLTFGEEFKIYSDNTKIIKDTTPLTYETVFSTRLFYFFFNSLDYYTNSNYTSYGPLVYLTGVGLHGSAGVMGLPGASPHSGIGDLFFMGGPIYLLIFFYLYFRTQILLYKNRNVELSNTLFMCNILFFINMIFVSGALFQPSISIVFWISIAYIHNQITLRKVKV